MFLLNVDLLCSNNNKNNAIINLRETTITFSDELLADY